MSASPVVVGLDPEREDIAPLIVGAAMARISGAPLVAIGAYLHDPISNAVSGGTVDADLRDARGQARSCGRRGAFGRGRNAVPIASHRRR